MQMVYDKLTRLSTSAKSKMGSGAIQNLQSNDTNRISLLPRFGHNLWSGPFQVNSPGFSSIR